jgi:Orsellinic acid/F9775 biosynthesis cluster protein D
MIEMKGEDINRYLRYDKEFKVLICLSCQYCLTPSGVERHFRNQHGVIPINIRKELVQFSKDLPVVEAKDVQMPSIEIEAIAGLKVITGVLCHVCGALYGTPMSMEIHCRERHGWRRWQGLTMQ